MSLWDIFRRIAFKEFSELAVSNQKIFRPSFILALIITIDVIMYVAPPLYRLYGDWWSHSLDLEDSKPSQCHYL